MSTWAASLYGIGLQEGLTGPDLDMFVNFFIERYPQCKGERYAREWAQRFKEGHELEAGDRYSCAIILQLERELKPVRVRA